MINVADYLEAASAKIDPTIWCYFEGGAGDEVTLRANTASYGRWRFRPRMLGDGTGGSTATTAVGTPGSVPLLGAPVAMHGLLAPGGELATAPATTDAGTLPG